MLLKSSAVLKPKIKMKTDFCPPAEAGALASKIPRPPPETKLLLHPYYHEAPVSPEASVNYVACSEVICVRSLGEQGHVHWEPAPRHPPDAQGLFHPQLGTLVVEHAETEALRRQEGDRVD